MLKKSRPSQLDLSSGNGSVRSNETTTTTTASASALSSPAIVSLAGGRSSPNSNWLSAPQARKATSTSSTTPTPPAANNNGAAMGAALGGSGSSSPRPFLHSPNLGNNVGFHRSGSLRSISSSSTTTLRNSVRFAFDSNSNNNNNNNSGRRDVDDNSNEEKPQQQQQQQRHSQHDEHLYRPSSLSPQPQLVDGQLVAVNKRRKMADSEKEETINLQVEFEWVLHEEVHSVLKNLHTILVECAHRFPVPLYGNEGRKIDKFSLILPQEGLKCIVTLTGDSITHADICYKLQRFQNQVQRVSINPESPWKLQQVQDAANHLQQAIHHIDNVDSSYNFKSSDEVLHILGNILAALQRGRTSLVTPKKKPIDELMKSRNMKSLTPNLPDDQAISFYLQSHKLIFAVYQLANVQGVMKFDSSHAECSVPWLNEVLVLFTVALQLCQQLKDKISVFSTYKDFTVGSRSPSALSY